MSVFGAYSRYYDLLYRDKDYAGEAAYLGGLIRRHHPDAVSLLDLGCGTGRHAILLAGMGFETTGVERSEEMLARAQERCSDLEPRSAGCCFRQGDLRTVRLGRTYDAVVSLFHVISYQSGNDDLQAAFGTASRHLSDGGVFIFDCWYGPAVLTDRPVVRVKRLEDEAVAVTRIAEPVLHPNENLVEVLYHIFVRDRSTGQVEELTETHRMRYLFRPEVELLLAQAGLVLVEASEWLSGREPGCDTWGVTFVARKGGQ